MYSWKTQLEILDAVIQEQYNDICLADPYLDYNFKRLIKKKLIIPRNPERGTYEKQYPNKVLPVELTPKGERYRYYLQRKIYMDHLQQLREWNQQIMDRDQRNANWFTMFAAVIGGGMFLMTLAILILTIIIALK